MGTINTSKILALTTAVIIAFANLQIAWPVLAEYRTELMLQVSTKPDYEFVVPSDTAVSSSGWSTLASDLGVKNLKAKEEVNKIRIDADSNNDWSFKNGENKIIYELKENQIGSHSTVYDFENVDAMSTDTGETKRLGIDIANYDKKPEGDYTDTITWTSLMDLKAQELKVKNQKDGSYITSKTININKDKEMTLEAVILPSDLEVVYDWINSDSTIVEIVKLEKNPKSVKIKGVSFGSSTLTVNAGGLNKIFTVRVIN